MDKILEQIKRGANDIISEEELKKKLECYVKEIVKVAFELEPFLPETSKKIQEQFLTDQISSQPSLFPRIWTS